MIEVNTKQQYVSPNVGNQQQHIVPNVDNQHTFLSSEGDYPIRKISNKSNVSGNSASLACISCFPSNSCAPD